jgi:hypothetical protein
LLIFEKVIPKPATIEEYDNREFAIEEKSFSSLAHMVGLTRSTDQVIFHRPKNNEEQINAICMDVDASVTGWFSLLPSTKQDMIMEDGAVDQIMWQCQMIIAV